MQERFALPLKICAMLSICCINIDFIVLMMGYLPSIMVLFLNRAYVSTVFWLVCCKFCFSCYFRWLPETKTTHTHTHHQNLYEIHLLARYCSYVSLVTVMVNQILLFMSLCAVWLGIAYSVAWFSMHSI